ncbi:MAG: flagellar biosynthesis protein FlgA [Alicyclobacillus sp.]|nr:flagellar biosynthesis protein FlgA [Alicyclobacillus sp.]
MKPWLKYSIAATLFVVGVGGSVTYNQFLAPYLDSEWVYVAAQPLDANTPIQASDWKRERIPKEQVSPGAITNVSDLADAYTSQAMSQNQQFTALDTQPDPFTITPGTEDVPIPSSWIASVSQTLRQGDYVDIVPLAPSQSGSTPAPRNAMNASTNSHKTLNNLLVLSVHTSTNQEVTNQPQPSDTETVGARHNGTGTPSNLDLKMTTAQAQLLTSYIEKRYQLLIVGVTPRKPVGK